jgi:hypothetical protein
MAGSDPAGRPPPARLGPPPPPPGPTLFLDRSRSRRIAATPGAPSGSWSRVGLGRARNPCWFCGVGTGKLMAGGHATRERLQLNRGVNGFDFGG